MTEAEPNDDRPSPARSWTTPTVRRLGARSTAGGSGSQPDGSESTSTTPPPAGS